jgi:hypothetical protein
MVWLVTVAKVTVAPQISKQRYCFGQPWFDFLHSRELHFFDFQTTRPPRRRLKIFRPLQPLQPLYPSTPPSIKDRGRGRQLFQRSRPNSEIVPSHPTTGCYARAIRVCQWPNLVQRDWHSWLRFFSSKHRRMLLVRTTRIVFLRTTPPSHLSNLTESSLDNGPSPRIF